jgi:O-antigen/teichoic acid export membrane protein
MTLSKKTTTGILWNFGEQLGRRGVGILFTLLLARFLVPADYGLVAMMAVFLALGSSLMESGFKQALIRKQGATQTDFNVAFYANLALGAVSYILLFVAAPFIADFYQEAKLIALIRVAALAVPINAFQVVQSAILSRALNFKAQLQATIPASMISGTVAVGLAYAGFGVWALVTQMLLAALVTTVLLWRLQGWRPTLSFSKDALGSMYNFGYKLFLSGLLDTVFKNIFVIVIAKLFSTTLAGYYFFADRIKELIISQLVTSIQMVTYPALSTMQDDNERLKAGYRKVISVTTFLLFPAMGFMAALAEPLFRALLPEQWLPAVVYLQLMCIASLLLPLHAINLNILKVKGRSDLFLYLEIIKKLMVVLILCVSVQFGIMGILIGQIVSSVLAYLPNSYFSAKLINYPVRQQIADFAPGLVLSAAVGGAAYVAVLIFSWPAIVELLVFGTLAVALYLLVAYALKFQALMLAIQLVQKQKMK